MSKRCVIGVDIGTSGCRAVAIDNAGKSIAGCEVTLPAPVRTPDGGFEQDPALWWDAVRLLLKRLSGQLGDPDCARLCVDATSSTTLLATPDGTPLGPALMYNDSRCRDEAARIAQVAGADSAARGASSSLAKLLKLSRLHSPSSPVLALHQADWIAGRLMGVYGDSDWNNALKLGFDPAAGKWADWMPPLLDPLVALPRVHAPGKPLGRISVAVAKALGLPQDIVICAGTTDSTAATAAAGAKLPGDAVTSLGSTLVLKIVAERPISAPRFGVYSHRFGDHWLVGGASNSGGAALRQFFDTREIEALSELMDPSIPSDLDYYPLPAPGERFPVSDPLLPPRIAPRPADDALFLHGLLEGIARIERDGYRLLTELGAPRPRHVVTIGGGARNPQWTALRSRVLGLDVTRATQQSAAYGAAMIAQRYREV